MNKDKFGNERESDLQVRVTGGTEDERVHLAFTIGDALIGGRGFKNTKFEFEGIDKEQIPAKLLRWEDVYSKINHVMQTKNIAIRALRDIDEKNILDRTIYDSEPVTKLHHQLEKVTDFMEKTGSLDYIVTQNHVEESRKVLSEIASDSLCAHTDV